MEYFKHSEKPTLEQYYAEYGRLAGQKKENEYKNMSLDEKNSEDDMQKLIKKENKKSIIEIFKARGIDHENTHYNTKVGDSEYSQFFKEIIRRPRMWMTASGGLPFGEADVNRGMTSISDWKKIAEAKPVKYKTGYQGMSIPAETISKRATHPVNLMVEQSIIFRSPLQHYDTTDFNGYVVMGEKLYTGGNLSGEDGWVPLNIVAYDENNKEHQQLLGKDRNAMIAISKAIPEIIAKVEQNPYNSHNILASFLREVIAGDERKSFGMATLRMQSILEKISELINECNGDDVKLTMLCNDFLVNREIVIEHTDAAIQIIREKFQQLEPTSATRYSP